MGENPIFLFDDFYRKELQSTFKSGFLKAILLHFLKVDF